MPYGVTRTHRVKTFFFACLFLRWIKTTWTISKWSDNIKSKYVLVISKPLIKQMLGYCKRKIGIYFNKSLIKIQTFSVKTAYGDLDLSQHRLRKWLVAWWHQAITWTKVDLSSVYLAWGRVCICIWFLSSSVFELYRNKSVFVFDWKWCAVFVYWVKIVFDPSPDN